MIKKREPAMAAGRGATIVREAEAKRSLNIDFGALLNYVPNIKQMVVLLLVALFVALYQYKGQLLAFFDHPVSIVEVHGTFTYQSQSEIEDELGELVGSSFLFTDLNQVKDMVVSSPWIYNSTVSRVWPGRLVVVVEEQVPVAFWNNGSLVNEFGDIFTPSDASVVEDLPILKGQVGASRSSTLAMLSMYENMNQQLGGYGLSLMDLKQDERGAWEIGVANGLNVKLGRGDLVDKIDRFGRVYDAQLKQNLAQVERVDARYPNGVAVEWKQDASSMELAVK